jgi:hypothetical protein
LRDIQVEVTASNFENAGQIAHEVVMLLISQWAFLHDVALTTAGMQITEQATQTRSLELMLPGAVKAYSDGGGPDDPDHRVLLSAYREALSSFEPLWQALSLYKVAEGVWTLRGRQRKEVAGVGGTASHERSERVPEDVTSIGHQNDRGALDDALRPYAGQKFRTVFDDVRAAVRNASAHLDRRGEDALAQDSWNDMQQVRRMLPGFRWMSWQLLAAEFEDCGYGVEGVTEVEPDDKRLIPARSTPL